MSREEEFVSRVTNIPAWRVVRAIRECRHDTFAARESLRAALQAATEEWRKEFWSQARIRGLAKELQEWLSTP
jgi:hypothetical protein